MQLRRLAHQRRDPDGVLEQATRVRVVSLGGRQLTQRFPTPTSALNRSTTLERPG